MPDLLRIIFQPRQLDTIPSVGWPFGVIRDIFCGLRDGRPNQIYHWPKQLGSLKRSLDRVALTISDTSRRTVTFYPNGRIGLDSALFLGRLEG